MYLMLDTLINIMLKLQAQTPNRPVVTIEAKCSATLWGGRAYIAIADGKLLIEL